MPFKATFCDPFKKDIIVLGEIEQNAVIDSFINIPWEKYLNDMTNTPDDKIYYSPSLGIENTANNSSLEISAVDDGTRMVFYVFYQRPKMVTKFFGLKKEMIKDYISNITDQNKENVIMYLEALLNNNLELLESRIK